MAMQNDQIFLIDKMFEYNLWANTRLIEVCSDLDVEQLETEIAGVFGRIHPTLVHIIRAEGGYLNRVTGSRPWAEDLDWDNMPMSDLLAKAQLSGNQLIAIAGKADPATPHLSEWDGQQFHFFNWTVILQALYHGIEHRTQIKFLLTQLGVAHPELDGWNYVESLSSE
jgi:uncharacterized damage-inducible protein DinB